MQKAQLKRLILRLVLVQPKGTCMPKKANITTFTEELLKQSFVWDDIFAVRETDHFITCQPPAIQRKIDKIRSMIVENEARKKPHFQQWNIVSKHDHPTVCLHRIEDDFVIYLKMYDEKVLWLEGIACKKHAFLHVHALMSYFMNYFFDALTI